MDLIVKRDIQKLMTDTEQVNQLVEVLEQNHSIRAREHVEKNLEKFMKHAKQLELDVSMMMIDRLTFIRNEQGKGVIEDLKKVRLDLSEANFHPKELGQLEIDWGRFMKRIGQILKYLRDREGLMKVRDVLPSRKEGERNVSSSTTY